MANRKPSPRKMLPRTKPGQRKCANDICTCLMVVAKSKIRIGGLFCCEECYYQVRFETQGAELVVSTYGEKKGKKFNDDFKKSPKRTCWCRHQACEKNLWVTVSDPTGPPGHKCGTVLEQLTKPDACGCCVTPTMTPTLCISGCPGVNAHGACTCGHLACTTDANPCPTRT